MWGYKKILKEASAKLDKVRDQVGVIDFNLSDMRKGINNNKRSIDKCIRDRNDDSIVQGRLLERTGLAEREVQSYKSKVDQWAPIIDKVRKTIESVSNSVRILRNDSESSLKDLYEMQKELAGTLAGLDKRLSGLETMVLRNAGIDQLEEGDEPNLISRHEDDPQATHYAHHSSLIDPDTQDTFSGAVRVCDGRILPEGFKPEPGNEGFKYSTDIKLVDCKLCLRVMEGE